MKDKFKIFETTLLILIISAMVIVAFKEGVGFLIRTRYLEDYYNKDELQYEIGFTYIERDKRRVPWGIVPLELKCLEKSIPAKENKCLVYSNSKNIKSYYFNDENMFYSIKVDEIMPEENLSIILYWLEKNYSINLNIHTTIEEQITLENVDSLELEELLMKHDLKYYQMCNTKSVCVELLIQKYDEENIIISYIFTNNKLIN